MQNKITGNVDLVGTNHIFVLAGTVRMVFEILSKYVANLVKLGKRGCSVNKLFVKLDFDVPLPLAVAVYLEPNFLGVPNPP